MSGLSYDWHQTDNVVGIIFFFYGRMADAHGQSYTTADCADTDRGRAVSQWRYFAAYRA